MASPVVTSMSSIIPYQFSSYSIRAHPTVLCRHRLRLDADLSKVKIGLSLHEQHVRFPRCGRGVTEMCRLPPKLYQPRWIEEVYGSTGKNCVMICFSPFYELVLYGCLLCLQFSKRFRIGSARLLRYLWTMSKM